MMMMMLFRNKLASKTGVLCLRLFYRWDSRQNVFGLSVRLCVSGCVRLSGGSPDRLAVDF